MIIGDGSNVLLNVEDVAARYGVNGDTIRRWIRQGRIPAFRVGGAYRIRLNDLLTLEAINYKFRYGHGVETKEPF